MTGERHVGVEFRGTFRQFRHERSIADDSQAPAAGAGNFDQLGNPLPRNQAGDRDQIIAWRGRRCGRGRRQRTALRMTRIFLGSTPHPRTMALRYSLGTMIVSARAV